MIARIKGKIVGEGDGYVVIDVSGVGYKAHISPHTMAVLIKAPDIEVSLWTYMAVRENSMDLYGFVDRKEQRLFELLISVPGIGPKSALAILSLATVKTLHKSIVSGDTTYLTKVSGIGKKSAQKIVIELKDKLDGDGGGPDLKEESDAVDALRSLGYTLAESREALKKVTTDIAGTSARVKAALKLLGK